MPKGARIPYSKAEMAWLRDNQTLVLGDYHREFCKSFGRSDVTVEHLNALRKRKGWKVGRAGGRYMGRSLLFSREEIDWLHLNCTTMIPDLHRAFCETFLRKDITAGQLLSLRKRRNWRTGRSGRFEKGMIPPNKGMRCAPGTGGRHPNAQRTHFKKGERKGRAARLYKPIGAERISKDGYRERKVHDGLPMQSRWQTVQRIEWEAAHGLVPEGMVLKCRDGNKLNTEPSNWQLVPRAIIPRLNGGPHRRRVSYDQAPAELKPTLMAVAKLEHEIRTKRRAL
jgi:hypothetical protein